MEAEVFVIVDSEGSYVSHCELDEAHTLADDNSLVPCRRVIRVVLNVPLPEMIEVTADIPEEPKAASVKVS